MMSEPGVPLPLPPPAPGTPPAAGPLVAAPPGWPPSRRGWNPSASPAGWNPSPGGRTPAPPGPPAPTGQPGTPARRRGVAGSLLAALVAALKYGLGLGKYGFALLKLAKLGPTLVSMVLSLGLLAVFYGPVFGAGLLVLIAVHETGHLLFARREGIRVGMPIFLGPFGALIGLRQPPRDARQEAVIAIGGPVVGTAGALACYLLAMATPPGRLHGLLIALAYVGFFLNLFNLVPMTPLDGGRVASALSRWANVVGLAVVAGLVAVSAAAGTLNPFLVVILLIGGLGTLQRFRQARTAPGYAALPARTRLWIGAAYLGMLAVTALGMSIAHAHLGVRA
jgi:Zn-dependent protease